MSSAYDTHHKENTIVREARKARMESGDLPWETRAYWTVRVGGYFGNVKYRASEGVWYWSVESADQSFFRQGKGKTEKAAKDAVKEVFDALKVQ
jgi:hypothetical protein